MGYLLPKEDLQSVQKKAWICPAWKLESTDHPSTVGAVEALVRSVVTSVVLVVVAAVSAI